jgi:hypothetical protein
MTVSGWEDEEMPPQRQRRKYCAGQVIATPPIANCAMNGAPVLLWLFEDG